MNRWKNSMIAVMVGLGTSAVLQAAPVASAATASTRDMGEMTPAQALQLALDMAATLERIEKYPDAMGQYERALAIDPRNAQAMRRMAVLCSKTGQFERADMYFQKAVHAQPHNANVLNDWGRSYYLRASYAAAEKKWACIGAMPSQFGDQDSWQARTRPDVPAGDRDRRAFLLDMVKGRNAAVADKYRAQLIALYGEQRGRQVKYAEAFQLCQYGRQPSGDELKRLFPVTP